MPSGRIRALLRSIRFRLTFWNTAALLGLHLVALVGIREGLRFTLDRELDNLLIGDAKEVEGLLADEKSNEESIKKGLDLRAFSHEERGWFGQIVTDTGRVWLESRVPPEVPLAGSPDRELYTVGNYRLIQRTTAARDDMRVTIRVGSSLDFVQEDVDRLTQMMLVAGGVILVVAPLLGYFQAGKMTNPLAQIVRTTATLRADRPGDRLTLRNTGDELDQLSATINGLLDRLAADLVRHRDFIANAAHELRSPLTALRTALDVAQERDRAPDEYRELLADLGEECAGLSKLVNQLLLLAEGEGGQLKPGEAVVRLDDVAARAVDMFRGVAEQFGVELRFVPPAPTPIRGEVSHVRQIVNNLIDNALKFTPPGGSVAVEVAADSGAGLAVLRVRDTGLGIAAADLPRVFDRFYRADRARRRERAGSGLGLSICQVIVAAYGGEIAAESTPGRGSTFTVTLPLARM